MEVIYLRNALRGRLEPKLTRQSLNPVPADLGTDPAEMAARYGAETPVPNWRELVCSRAPRNRHGGDRRTAPPHLHVCVPGIRRGSRRGTNGPSIMIDHFIFIQQGII